MAENKPNGVIFPVAVKESATCLHCGSKLFESEHPQLVIVPTKNILVGFCNRACLLLQLLDDTARFYRFHDDADGETLAITLHEYIEGRLGSNDTRQKDSGSNGSSKPC